MAAASRAIFRRSARLLLGPRERRRHGGLSPLPSASSGGGNSGRCLDEDFELRVEDLERRGRDVSPRSSNPSGEDDLDRLDEDFEGTDFF